MMEAETAPFVSFLGEHILLDKIQERVYLRYQNRISNASHHNCSIAASFSTFELDCIDIGWKECCTTARTRD